MNGNISSRDYGYVIETQYDDYYAAQERIQYLLKNLTLGLDLNYIDLNPDINLLKEIRDAKYTGVIVWQQKIYCWFVGGLLHRDQGPAWIHIDSYSGSLKKKDLYSFYLNGILYKKEKWFENISEEKQIEALFNINEW